MSMSPTSTHRLKVAAVPLLAVVLIYLVVPTADHAALEPAASAAAPGTVPIAKPADSLAPSRHVGPLPPLANLLAANPFEPITSAAATAASLSAEADDELTRRERLASSAQQFRVSAIYQSSAGPAALVENRLVRVGDLLEPNLRVIGIRPDGIEVAEEE